ncbi:transcriptional regulator [Pedobacter miscanthi]|uniref:Transcriptional regulator n=1 Tax=Pedobacter miscanthi TaxID=2259170 RepID=A0A366KZ24_9SPHI|nr:transcriptional regulator [Pedobacter miscanthi]
MHHDPKDCHIIRTVEVIGNKWKPVILVQLFDGPVRFGKLRLFIPSISQKILTQQLRELEQDGLIVRNHYKEKVPRVEYEISEKGKTLTPVLQAMFDWGKNEHPPKS